jgi:c-di-GMP-binding flagellar brake protein YcgR
MTGENKRRHARIRSLNLSHIFVAEDEGSDAVQGMGRTLNVSESGILLETTFIVPSGDPVIITLGLENEILEVHGRVVYNKSSTEGRYETGIEFTGLDETTRPQLQRFIRALGE